ncbi:hepatitis A virus cellular receptor 1 homolog isoform X2 [Sparus aurata]|uniref:Hepatitis A virus cellular receptor 1 homolog n=1 Tax=Sparus aurata TaxID=8175 RepID=A0A671TPI4_SPAAU|nr:hepatitis A virus cellular receptor 1 homolog isoform X2 [Sparus aurata]
MKIVLLLALLTVSECGSSSVVGQTGQNVTLSCTYDFKYNRALAVCWGRGHIPSSGCNNQLISTDGRKVIEGTRASSRYQLLGQLDKGDVSLTILNLTDSDAGRYGCRVDIPGWFNDDKHHFDLTIKTAPQTTTSTVNTETSTEQPAANYTSTSIGHMNFTGALLTSSSSSISVEENNIVPVVLVCVLFGLIALVTAGGLVIIIRRWTLLHKIPPQQQVNSWAQFTSTSSSLHLHRQSSAVENVYQIDGGGDGGEYEYCP